MARKATELRPVMTRLPERLRARLEKAASKNDESMNSEIIRRLERSFGDEDIVAEALGGPELRNLALLLISSFAFTGQQYAAANSHPEWTTKDWLTDQDCYRAAAVKVATILMEGMPQPTPEEKALFIHTLTGRIATGLAEDGVLKFHFTKNS